MVIIVICNILFKGSVHKYGEELLLLLLLLFLVWFSCLLVAMMRV